MSFDLQHIICAVDFSTTTAGVLHAGRILARVFGARLSVFHAVTTSQDRFLGTVIFERGGQQADLLVDARKRLEGLAAPLKDADTVVMAGDPVDTLSDYLKKTPAGLTVAARRGFSGIQRVLLGSVVERMARRLATPLLVVDPTKASDGNSQPFRKVAVACDAVDAITPALTAAMVLARRFGAALHMLHAMELPVNSEILEPTDGPYDEVQTALQRRLRQNMEKLTAAGAGAPSVAIDILPGPAAEILPPYVRQHKVDLLVLGVRPRRRLQKWLIGSTTEAALRHVSCAVLTVPATMR